MIAPTNSSERLNLPSICYSYDDQTESVRIPGWCPCAAGSRSIPVSPRMPGCHFAPGLTSNGEALQGRGRGGASPTRGGHRLQPAPSQASPELRLRKAGYAHSQVSPPTRNATACKSPLADFGLTTSVCAFSISWSNRSNDAIFNAQTPSPPAGSVANTCGFRSSNAASI